MGEHDNFQERLRQVADQISRSMERLSEVDLDDLAARYGVDVDRARMFADAAEQWLTDHLGGNEPFFSHTPPPPTEHEAPVAGAPGPASEPQTRVPEPERQPPAAPGPHPLDLPTDRQGLALSALDSGRWTVRPGSNRLTGSGEGPPPPPDAPDLVSELRARDWITADGSLTLVGRRALTRWSSTAPEPPGADALTD